MTRFLTPLLRLIPLLRLTPLLRLSLRNS